MSTSLAGRGIKVIQALDGWRERSCEAPGWTAPHPQKEKYPTSPPPKKKNYFMQKRTMHLASAVMLFHPESQELQQEWRQVLNLRKLCRFIILIIWNIFLRCQVSTSSSGVANKHASIFQKAFLGLFPKELFPTYLLVEKMILKYETGKP